MESQCTFDPTPNPVSFVCSCSALSDPQGGLVLLFYRYYAAPPSLSDQPSEYNNESLAKFHETLTEKLGLGGKIRIGTEGFNITVGGTRDNIEAYMRLCLSHWSFQGLEICTPEQKSSFFKPSEGGCACAFGGPPANIRIAAEITPMGVTNYCPENWYGIDVLSPAEFHQKCHTNPEVMLLDVRNHYESRIGYFINPKTGEPALRPPIRRFSQWPQYVRKYMSHGDQTEQTSADGKEYLTYCTGGIRCEKGARYLQERLRHPGDRVATLEGGITAYLAWMEKEVNQGRMKYEESLFKGKNYVFDARGSIGDGLEPVSTCHECGLVADSLSKCRSKGCHLILVICPDCKITANVRCCQSCLEMDVEVQGIQSGPRSICACERQREGLLWGEGSRKLPKSKKVKKKGNLQAGGSRFLEVQVASVNVPIPQLASP